MQHSGNEGQARRTPEALIEIENPRPNSRHTVGWISLPLLVAVGVGWLTLGKPAEESVPVALRLPVDTLARTTTVPFEFPDSQVVFEAFIGEQGPFRLILDTAVNPSVIDLETARALKLPMDDGGGTRASGVGDDRSSAMSRVIPTAIAGLNVGGSPVLPFDAVAMDLRAFSEQVGRPLHGALGFSFLKSRAVRIDYPARTITFGEGLADIEGARASATQTVEFPMVLVGTDVQIESVSVNGHLMTALLDTGASPALTISSSAAGRLGLGDLIAAAEPGLVRGAGGTAQVFRTLADSIGVGPLHSGDARVTFAPWLQQTDALLGNGFLKDFVLTLDYSGKRVRIEQPAS
ncbi:MAG: aspartyl protease family protein [Longimicrobiales bacterium]